MNIQSTLVAITHDVFICKTCESAKLMCIEHLSTSTIKDKDKMIRNIKELTTLYQVHKYIANSLLKYEGLGIDTSIHEHAAVNTPDLDKQIIVKKRKAE